MTHLSVIVPLYNEERCIKRSYETITAYLDTITTDYEIILVNDGSNDNTGSIIAEMVKGAPQTRCLHIPNNKGKGHAVRSGILTASGEYVLFTDADLAVPVSFIGTCLKRLRAGVPMVIASRHLPQSAFKIREGPLRQFLGEIFRKFAQTSLALKVTDITCGLKGFHKKAALDIFSRSKIDRWGYDAEIIFLAQKLGYVIEEIPVDWYHSFESAVNIGTDAIRAFIEIFQVHYYYLRKKYRSFH